MRIVFSASKAIGSKAIRVGTVSRWSHVDLLFDDGTLIGATGKGVERITLEQRLNAGHIFRYRIDEISLVSETAARIFADAQVGKPYDYSAVLGFLWPWRGNWYEDDRWFCSELAAATCMVGGNPLVRHDMYRVTPGYIDNCPELKTVQEERHIQ